MKDNIDLITVATDDVNKDGNVDIKDIVSLKKYLSNCGNSINKSNADFDNSGKINSQDLTILKKILLGILL